VSAVLRHKGSQVWSVVPDTPDYARKVALQSKSSKDTLVRDIMTTSVITVTPDQTVDKCMSIMTQRRIRHLPVVDRGQVIGIVSIGDLVRTVIAAQGEIIQHLHEYISGRLSA
jgi:CBS domain-containing protein